MATCDTSLLKSIGALCSEGNAPDLQDVIYVIPDESVVVPFPAYDADSLNVAADIAQIAKHFEQWNITKTNNSFDAGSKGTPDSPHFEPKLEFTLAKTSAIKSYALSKSRGRRLTFVFIDNNGSKRIMRHALVMFDETTKSENSYKVTVTCGPIPDPLPFYTGALPLA